MSDFSFFKHFRELLDTILTPSPKAVKGTFMNHTIEVMLTERKVVLYIDNKRVDSSRVYLYPDSDVALLRANISSDKKSHLVNVYGKSGLFSASLKICVDGERIAGEEF
jgi:hypothetical protein